MLKEQGFEKIAHCFSGAECDEIGKCLNPTDEVGTRCLLQNAWCRDLADVVLERVSATIPELMGLVSVQCTLFNKSSESNWLVAFHQDRSVPESCLAPNTPMLGRSQKEGVPFVLAPEAILVDMVALRLHLDDSSLDNGPLRVIPGSHVDGILAPEVIQTMRETRRQETLTLSQGGVLAMRPLLLHASSKSTNSASRRVLHFLFAPKI